MALTLISPPVEEPISVAEVRAHLRVDGADEDAYIAGLIAAARQHIDGRDGWLNRALVTQEWRLCLEEFPAVIRLPLPPLQSVTSITYTDREGQPQSLDETDYVVEASDRGARLRPASGKNWPTVRRGSGAVAVEFAAGYGAAADVPAPIKQAMLLLIGHWYEHREAVNVGNIVNTMPLSVEALLMPYRVWSF